MLALRNIILPLSLLFFLIAACSSDSRIDQDRVVAEINDFTLTKEEFQKSLLKELRYSEKHKTTKEGKKEFLDSIIKKELLIQEAVKLGLDKKPDFIYAIEKHWEATLIKLLMETKNNEILQVATVSEKEIQNKYNELKKSKKTLPPLDQIEKEIADELTEMKRTAILYEWIDELHKNARIKINSKLLNE